MTSSTAADDAPAVSLMWEGTDLKLQQETLSTFLTQAHLNKLNYHLVEIVTSSRAHGYLTLYIQDFWVRLGQGDYWYWYCTSTLSVHFMFAM